MQTDFIKYRKEIDGLRALAVIPVILFHAGIDLFSGGFVGVDIFFVVSGYLITSLILTQKASGIFSLTDFYERRARRILPALFIMITVCIPFAWLWLLPKEMQDFSESLTSVALFMSNHFFLNQSGYFDTDAELKPLLHTWSLAVEQQFYIFFPLLILFIWQFLKRWSTLILVTLTLLSFALAHWFLYKNPSAAFFLLASRAWEMTAGSLIALFFIKFQTYQLPKFVHEAGGILGILLIVYAIFAYSNETPFPGAYALVPVVGTALIIICATTHTLVGRLLNSKILVSLGLISYSLYLWHQPVFSFARHKSVNELSNTILVALIILVFSLSIISYILIEKPIRQRVLFKDRKIFIAICLIFLICLLIFGSIGKSNKGFEGRFSEPAFKPLFNSTKVNYVKSCMQMLREEPSIKNACVIGHSNLKPSYALLGDSHAASLIDAFHEYSIMTNISGLGFTFANCLPMKNSFREEYTLDRNKKCENFKKDFFSNLNNLQTPEVLIISGRWTFTIEKNRFDNMEGGLEKGASASWVNALTNSIGYQKALATDLKSSIHLMLNSGKKLILIYPVPEMGWNVPNHLTKLLRNNGALDAADGSVSYGVFKARNEKAYKILDDIGYHPNLHRVYPEFIFCNTFVPNRCISHVNGFPIYRDDDHLSRTGALMVLESVKKYIKHDLSNLSISK